MKDSQQALALEESSNEVSQQTKAARFDEVPLGMYMWCLNTEQVVCRLEFGVFGVVVWKNPHHIPKSKSMIRIYVVFVVWMLQDAYAVTVSETALEEELTIGMYFVF